MTTDSSSVEGQVADSSVDAGQQQTTDVSAESSAAEGVKHASPLEAVKAALAGNSESKAADAPSESPAKGEGSQSSESQTDSSDEDEKLPFGKHPRFKQLVEERNALKTQLAELTDAKVKAESFDRIQSFVADAGLTAQEVDQGMAIMSMMKNDPVAALQALAPYVDALRKLSGDQLPDDLQQRVAEGYIDEETAKELSRLRSQTALKDQKLQQTQQREQQQTVQQQANQMGDAVSAWEKNWQKNDPDYEFKRDFVRSRVRELIQEHGAPRNIQQAIHVAEVAKKEVEERFRGRLSPSRQPTRTVTGGASNGSGVTAPKSALDVAKMALAGNYRGTQG